MGKIDSETNVRKVHSSIQRFLSAAINAVVKPQHVPRAFSELQCTFGESTVPDVSVFTWDRIPRDEMAEIANVFNCSWGADN